MDEETPLGNLGISRRAQGALAKAGITTLEQAQALGWGEARGRVRTGLRAHVGEDTINRLKAAVRGDSAPGSRAEREKMRREVYLCNLAAGEPEEVSLERADRAVAVYFGGEDA